MIGAELLPGERQADPAMGRAPMLPVEGHVAACTIALVEARDKIAAALWLIQNAPRLDALDTATFDACRQVADARRHFEAYRHVLACEGSC